MIAEKVDILVVEDHPMDAELTLRSIRRHLPPVSVYHARDGAEALDFFARGNIPGLVLLDLKLPKVNGLEVLSQLRQRRQLHSMPIVVFTSSDLDLDREKSKALGASDYIVKPINFKEYSDLVIRTCQHWLPSTSHAGFPDKRIGTISPTRLPG